MGKPPENPSVFDEPHVRGNSIRPDPTEHTAARSGARSAAAEENDAVAHSVWDEPGLSAELAVKPDGDGRTYAEWLRKRRAGMTAGKSWLITLAIALAAGPWAVLGALGASRRTGVGLLAMLVFGPVIEEIMKTAAAYYVVEVRPYLFRSAGQIAVCVLAGALAFAAIENLLYIHVCLDDPSPGLIRWRWTVCVGLHMGCSCIAGMGLIRVWRDGLRRCARPRLTLAFPFMAAAMAVHGVYNAVALGLQLIDFQF